LEESHPTDTDALASIGNRLSTLLEVHAESAEVLSCPELLRLQRDVIEKSPDRRPPTRSTATILLANSSQLQA
jgi:hypothetical protein